MTDAPQILHGTAIAINDCGILLLGKSGSGKSDLALRLIDRGAILISDDAVRVLPGDAGPELASAPNIAGQIEMRGVGIINTPFVSSAPLRLIVQLDAGIERLPLDSHSYALQGFDIPALVLHAFEASAPLKVEQRVKTVIDAALLPVAVERPKP